jgi:hypothetical protein
LYTKFTNAYDENDAAWPADKGVPILGTSTTADAMLLQARRTVVNMLRARPWRSNPFDVRDKMVDLFGGCFCAVVNVAVCLRCFFYRRTLIYTVVSSSIVHSILLSS